LGHSNLAAVRQSKKELSLYEWPTWPIQDAVRNEVDLSEVIAGFEKALSVNPQNCSAARRLGQIELSIGEYEDALDHLKLAYLRTPWDNASRQLLGEAYLVNGFVEEGRSLWDSVNNSQDQLKAREFWYNYIGDDMRANWIREGTQ
jgi:tetratricopeptide (TPR) repeat protein